VHFVHLDFHTFKLSFKANPSILANGTERGEAGKVTIEELDWLKEPAGLLAERLPASVVMAADCTYNPEYFDIFLQTLIRLTADRGEGSSSKGSSRIGSGNGGRSSGGRSSGGRSSGGSGSGGSGPRIVLLSHDRDSVPSRVNHCEGFIRSKAVQVSRSTDLGQRIHAQSP
jgi:hypothetical protein